VRGHPAFRSPAIGRLILPAFFFLTGTAVLVIGGRHFGNGWPGTGGHPWAHQGLVPGGVAAFTWASTLWVSSYWAHPGSLALFPAAELAWMAISPVAIAFLLTGATKTIRRAGLSSRTLRYEAFLARAAAFGMFAFLLGACTWVVSGGPGPGRLFHAGAIDMAAIIVMTAALAVAHRAIQRARYGGVALLDR